ncbi:Os02g0781400 [Oryza sativa Japonica Group]|uniref:20 kDa chaperonin, chloroplastic n=2 Tax=Oryza sativa subsp. japonica TaxID=39947 RepID=Q6K822_ORYSJ|nr:hypothetical protein EE612_014058 [Oryza sativa]KAF2947264.1 hypothetical protein DAI22_02g357000 [Oryza sativa Japonica Group]BAD19442.1 putative 20 kDa chaperonin, chloroplast [Oryza sativa Japonica Group]BAG99583.1 unnamed protein product [Oryza sativa Japonica Group]BAS81222.1 Os02g0781400 [Oryza sativa Japonica Group]
MAPVQFSAAGVGAVAFATKGMASRDALRLPPPAAVRVLRQAPRPSRGLVVRAAAASVAPKVGSQVVYSKYAGTEVELNDSNHLILKEDDIIGILETDDAKDMKPLSDRVLIKVAEAEDKTPGGLLLTETTKEKPSIGTVVAVGPGPLDEEGKRIPLSVSAGSTVLYSKYAGSEFKGSDGTSYIVLRVSDLMAVLS